MSASPLMAVCLTKVLYWLARRIGVVAILGLLNICTAESFKWIMCPVVWYAFCDGVAVDGACRNGADD